MARIQYGPIISDISGSIGSATFQKSLYGNTLRNKPTGHKSATPVQFTTRNIMCQCQYAWQALSVAQRKQWDQFIAFSGAKINRDRAILLTGHSLFLKYNFQRLLKGLSVLSVPTYISAPAWPSVTSITYAGNNVYSHFNANIDTLELWITLFISAPHLSSQSFSAQGLRYLPIGYSGGTYVNFENTYPPIFGRILTNGDIVHVKYQFWSRISPLLSFVRSSIFTVIPD